MDWTLTGAVTGVAVLAGVVAYESFALVHSGPEPAKDHASAVLIPARDRPTADVNAIPSPPVVAYASPQPADVHAIPSPPVAAYPPPQQTKPTDISNDAASQYPPRIDTPTPLKRMNPTMPAPTVSRPNEHPSLADYGSSANNVPAPSAGGPNVHPPAIEAKTHSQVSSDIWKVERTAKASYFNLGGHVDNNGVVDSLASGYLRTALKKQQNYAKLPPPIKTYIDAPNINLAMIAGYRGWLGINDRQMEEEQGVKFIRVASRGIEMTGRNGDLDDTPTSIDAPPLDLSPLETMAFDLRREMTLGDPHP